MPGNSKTLRLREAFRFRSMRRHQEMRKGRNSGSTATQKLNDADDVILPPTSVPIVCVQCDSSVDAEEEDCERDLYRVRSFKRTSKGLISLGDSFRSSNTSSYGHPFHTPRCSKTSAIASLGRHSRLSESYAEAPNLITQRQEWHSTANALVTADSESGCSFSHYKPTSPVGSLQLPSTFSLSNIATPVKVQILGGPTVGKTMLCRQFLTAEFMGGKTESFSEDSVERFVVIEVDGWNRSLMLIDNIREEAAEESHSAEASLAFFPPASSTLDEPIHQQRTISATASNTELSDKTEDQRRKLSFCNLKAEIAVLDKKRQSESGAERDLSRVNYLEALSA
ncbi:unnamed protein product [Taenia asiatica]|uniref:GTP-binding protein GEM n=1 Tax=Taenia asiatica TaxID=60517 RepID=A0A0R3W6V2_TAEAS|nr:unnamed protein product [Taenia asiatica]